MRRRGFFPPVVVGVVAGRLGLSVGGSGLARNSSNHPCAFMTSL